MDGGRRTSRKPAGGGAPGRQVDRTHWRTTVRSALTSFRGAKLRAASDARNRPSMPCVCPALRCVLCGASTLQPIVCAHNIAQTTQRFAHNAHAKERALGPVCGKPHLRSEKSWHKRMGRRQRLQKLPPRRGTATGTRAQSSIGQQCLLHGPLLTLVSCWEFISH